jgi:hypothetical protein
MKRTLSSLLILTAVIALSACSRPTPAPLPTPTATYSPLILLPTQAPTAQLPTPTLPPAFTPTPGAFIPIDAEITVDNFFLRTGPGRMFEPITTYEIGSRVTLLGREPGNNWVLVQTEDSRSGWMNIDYLSFIGDVTPLPIFKVSNALVLHGHVWTVDNKPATKIGVSIFSPDNPNPDREDVAITNNQGEWYLYLPLSYTGNWTVGTNSYSEDSSAVDSNKNLVGKWPSAQLISLPMTADVNIEFAFQK